MAAKYKIADSTINASQTAIFQLRAAISEKTDVVTLQGEQLKNYLILIDALKSTISNDRELAMIDRIKLKAKLKKRAKIILGQSVAIVVLVVLVLGGS